MATSTLGTNANNSIPNAVQVPGSFITPLGTKFASILAAADLGTIDGAIIDDLNRVLANSGPMGGFSQGVLYVPNRGLLRCLPGDWVGVDNRGWPILLSGDTVANGLWTHNP